MSFQKGTQAGHNQDTMANLNRPISFTEIQAALNVPPTPAKSPRPDGFSTEYYQVSKKH